MSTSADATTPMPPEPRIPATLLLFGAFSLAAHAATFFLFQVGYPSHVTMPLPAPQVSLLTGDTPDQEALLQWIESEDPALVAASSHPVPERLFAVPYRPSYMTPRTAPRSLPEGKTAPEPAPGPDLLTLLHRVLPATAGAAAKMEPVRTRLLLSGALAGRSLAAPLALKTAVAGPLEQASVMLGVTPEGEVRFAFLQHSSGDPATDAAAVAQLARARFQTVDAADEIAWGFADLIWGDDAYPPAPK